MFDKNGDFSYIENVVRFRELGKSRLNEFEYRSSENLIKAEYADNAPLSILRVQKRSINKLINQAFCSKKIKVAKWYLSRAMNIHHISIVCVSISKTCDVD